MNIRRHSSMNSRRHSLPSMRIFTSMMKRLIDRKKPGRKPSARRKRRRKLRNPWITG